MSAARKVYVYRLKVTYPPTSHYEVEGEWDRNWEPANWAPEWNPDPDADTSFHWPRANRRYLSRTEADRRAALLISYGAKVEVERSQPVTWESDLSEAASSPE